MKTTIGYRKETITRHIGVTTVEVVINETLQKREKVLTETTTQEGYCEIDRAGKRLTQLRHEKYEAEYDRGKRIDKQQQAHEWAIARNNEAIKNLWPVKHVHADDFLKSKEQEEAREADAKRKTNTARLYLESCMILGTEMGR